MMVVSNCSRMWVAVVEADARCDLVLTSTVAEM